MSANCPHVLIISFPAPGHVIPLMELAHRIVEHGFRVTFVNTEMAHKRILTASAHGKEVIDDRIRLVSIPDGLESDEERKIPGKLSEAAFRVMPGKLEELIKDSNIDDNDQADRITCVIADQSLGWAQEVAGKLGIRRVAFLPAAAATLVLGFNIPKLIDDGIINKDGTVIKKQVVQLAPRMPLMKSAEFVWTSLGNSSLQRIVFEAMVQNNRFVKMADWLICNSTSDLEPGAFSLAPEIVPVGPLLASNRLGKKSSGHSWPEDSNCLDWLDMQPPNSVIYVAFGSSAVLSESQFEELALGLELTNRPFLWVVRPDLANSAPSIATRGLVLGWAPQQKVLNRRAVACFMSHCGWNSTVESVSNGVPILCWPHFADQFINRSYICDVWKVGLGFERDESGIVTREEIKNKVDQLLGSVAEYKETALHLKELIRNNAREGGSSQKNFTDFIKWLKA